MEHFVINVQHKSNPLALAVFWCFIGTTICATDSVHRSTLIFYFIPFRVCSRLDNPISTFLPHFTHKHTTAILLLCKLRFNNFFHPKCVCWRTKIKWPPPNILNRSSMCGCLEYKFTQLLKPIKIQFFPFFVFFSTGSSNVLMIPTVCCLLLCIRRKTKRVCYFLEYMSCWQQVNRRTKDYVLHSNSF